MEATVDKIETMFQKADADLDYLSRKLEFEFTSGEENQAEKPNPMKMLQKIADIKQEYAEIVKEAQAIKEAEKEAMDFFRGELMTLCETLERLQQNVGMKGEKCEDLDEVREMLGQGASSMEDSNPSLEEPFTMEPPREEPCTNETTECGAMAAVDLPSPYERRSQSKDFIEVDDSEFLTVSSLIRGRVKLLDVNNTYRILWRHFIEQGNSGALSRSEMYKMGLRVTGQTGNAKLKVLQTLKLLNMSKTGEVLSLF